MSQNNERRRGQDRRQRDVGPPRNTGERRQNPDRRQLEIAEVSFFQWASHFVKYQTEVNSEAAELAAEVLNRAR